MSLLCATKSTRRLHGDQDLPYYYPSSMIESTPFSPVYGIHHQSVDKNDYGECEEKYTHLDSFRLFSCTSDSDSKESAASTIYFLVDKKNRILPFNRKGENTWTFYFDLPLNSSDIVSLKIGEYPKNHYSVIDLSVEETPKKILWYGHPDFQVVYKYLFQYIEGPSDFELFRANKSCNPLGEIHICSHPDLGCVVLDSAYNRVFHYVSKNLRYHMIELKL